MFTTIKQSVIAVVLPAVLALLSVDPARAQTGTCQRTSTGQTSQVRSTQLQTQLQQQLSQVQTVLQQQITQLQTVLQQLQDGQITLPSTSQVTAAQLESRLQQRIAQLQTQLQQVQNRLAASAQLTSQLTATQVQARAALVRSRR